MTAFTNKIIPSGTVVGKLTVISLLEKRRNGQRVYACICICGAREDVRAGVLRRGRQGCVKCCPPSVSPADPLAAYRHAWKSYRDGAERRGFVFEISFEAFRTFAQQPCHYCSADPRITCWSKQAAIQQPMNGVDRRDSKQGYTLENCLPCCGQCNRAKSIHSYDDFMTWVNRIAATHAARVKVWRVTKGKRYTV